MQSFVYRISAFVRGVCDHRQVRGIAQGIGYVSMGSVGGNSAYSGSVGSGICGWITIRIFKRVDPTAASLWLESKLGRGNWVEETDALITRCS